MCSVAAAVDDLYSLGLGRTGRTWSLSPATPRTTTSVQPTGGMDQLASLRSVAGHALLCDMRSLETTPVPFDLEGAGLRMLVVDTRAEHAARRRRLSRKTSGHRAGGRPSSWAVCVPARRRRRSGPAAMDDPVLRRAGPGTWSPRTRGYWRTVRALGTAGRQAEYRRAAVRVPGLDGATTSRSPVRCGRSGLRDDHDDRRARRPDDRRRLRRLRLSPWWRVAARAGGVAQDGGGVQPTDRGRR